MPKSLYESPLEMCIRDRFTEAGVKSFFWNSGVITNEFDRMGCRIEREPIEHVGDGNINTDGISVGSIQVPTNGKPIIMLSDRQSTGAVSYTHLDVYKRQVLVLA